MSKARCSDCWGEFPLTSEYFYRNKSRKTGLSHICIKCDNERNKMYRMRGKTTFISQYELYKGDELLSSGTIKEISEKMGVQEQTVRKYMNPSYKNRYSNNCRRLVKLDDR